MKKLQITNDVTEDVTNDWAKQQENSDYHDSDQDQNQRVFY